MSRFRFTVEESSEGMRLDAFLEEKLKTSGQPLSKAKLRKLILAGVTRVNGRARAPGFTLRAGGVVDGTIDPALLHTDAPTRLDREWKMSEDSIAYEDESLIVVNKPYGLPTQPTLDPARANLFGELQKFLAERDGEGAYVGLHHRLDRDTSGLVLFTKTKDANKGVADLFKEHRIRKTYYAIGVRGSGSTVPELEFTTRNYLKKDSLKKGRMRVVRSGGDLAITHFRTLDRTNGYALFQAEPQTGRMHQIRVHLMGIGWAILGDETYGARVEGIRLALHAAILTFKHPISSLETEVRAAIPPDFQKCLKKADLTLPSTTQVARKGS